MMIALPLPLPQFLSYSVAICSALGDLHKNKQTHTDIRPQNINWESKNSVIELAHAIEGEQLSFYSDARLPYISPEQTGRMNRRIDYRTDLYSLGIVFYELLTGEAPFLSKDPLEMIHSHIAKKPTPAHERNAEIPKQVSAIVMRLLEKNTEDRYQSAFGLSHDLERCAEQLLKSGDIDQFELGESDLTGIFRIPQKLYGREEEVKILIDSFERISTGATELMLVAGYSGIGKTALVHEVQKPLTQKRGYFSEGKFDLYQRNIPYFAWSQAFGELVNQLLMESEDRLSSWKTEILEAVRPNGQVLTDVIPNLEKIIGPQTAVPELGGQEAQNRFNIAFQNFTKVIARKDHPLVVFLDDLQWTDAASLNLLNVLLTNPDLGHFLVIGAYRDNEVDDAHPLTKNIAELRQSKVNVDRITLQNLSKEDINSICAESLQCSLLESRPLSQLAYSKTAGNPFFSHQMLHTLYAEKMLSFDPVIGRWQWDMDAMEEMDIADNVVDLMASKLHRLPSATQEILRLAACIGNQFDLPTLVIIAQSSADTINSILQTALNQDVIFKKNKLYKFVHDRVQQAAYEQICEADKKSVHLQIGRLLQQNLSEQDQEEQLFEMLNHLNIAVELLSDPTERTQLADLNLRAVGKAKIASAFSDAKKYAEMGLKLLGVDCWQEQYALTLALHNENGELAYLTGQFDQVSTTMDVIQSNAKTIMDQQRINMIKIEAETMQYNFNSALEIGLDILKNLGVEITRQPVAQDYQVLKDRLVALLNDRSEENWAELPAMSDETALAASFILASEMSTSYIANPPLFPIISFHGAILTLEFGLNAWSPFFFGAVAMLTVAWIDQETPADTAIGKIEFVKQTRDIMTEMLENPVTVRSRTKALLMSAFITPWIEPLENGIAITQDTYNSGYEIGDLLYGAYGAQHFTIQAFAAGLNLEVYQSKVNHYIAELQRIGNEPVTQWLLLYLQTVQNFREVVPEPYKLKGTYLDEDEWLPSALAANDSTGLGKHAITKLMLSYHFDNDDQLGETIYQAVKFHKGGIASFTIPQFYLYFSLAKIRIIGISNSEDRTETMNMVNSYLELVGIWSQATPTTFQHKYDLIAAEMARVTDDLGGALSHYEDAISGAKENGFIHEEALANELYSRFWMERGNERFAGQFMREAHSLYQEWGALAKAEHLVTRYPEWMSKKLTPTTDEIATPLDQMTDKLDLYTIFKASQKTAGEIELKSLLAKIMDSVIENAGAQRGFLLMEEEGRWIVVAGGDFESNEVLLQEPQDLGVNEVVSRGIVNYVIRTQESVVLVDAANEGDFTHDHTIQHRQSRSVLCAPFINQGRISGIQYLENNLATGAFTLERVELLNLLSSQMAMALDNARLYADLELSEEKFKGVFNSMIDVFARSDLEGNCLLISPSVFDVIGYTPEEVVGRNYAVFYAQAEDWRLINKTLIEKGDVRDIESEVCKKDGSKIIISSNAKIYFDDEGTPAGIESVFRDITHRKDSEKQLHLYHQRLQAMASELIFTEERERQRIATELHDGPAQSLALARLQLAEATEDVAGSSSSSMIDEASQQVRQSLGQIRSVLLDLSSPTLHQMGLSAGLSEWLDENIRDKHGLRTVFRDECGDVLLAEEIRLLLFRNVCELLTNVVKHAQAQRVSVSMARVGQTLQIVVKDDGVGFDTASAGNLPEHSRGFGLFSIAVRMADMGGSLEMAAAPGKGCSATLVAPLEPTEEGGSQ